jgi:ATP-dependent DNA helicase RecG
MTISELKNLKETEDKVEFKEAKHNFSFAGSSHDSQEKRRKCLLGYVVAFANEKGGTLVLGMKDDFPHQVVGTDFREGKIGSLEDDVYKQLNIRIRIEELFESGLRVLVINIPSRPLGKTLKFEGVPLMRVGGSLRNMSDEELFAILSEQEPDFSERICEGAAYSDLDLQAISKLKSAYSLKQDNQSFNALDNIRALSDLSLIRDGKITNAAIILLGKEEAIKKYLPQAAVHLEYRNTLTQIIFDNRQIFSQAYFIAIDQLWQAIDQRNGKIPVQQGPYIFDIPFFNKEVIREAINNAIAHRDYRKSSEILIKQFPNELHIINPGGFPLGVTLENLLTVNSTPRNRLLADVLAKTGAVERSGQGIDKIFYQTISESKPDPDYTKSDNYQVELRLSALVEDKAFALFIREIQSDRKDSEKLSVQEVIVLNQIRKGVDQKGLDQLIIQKLEDSGLLQKVGKTNAQRRILSKAYYIFSDNKADYTNLMPLQKEQIIILIFKHLDEFKFAKMADFENLLNRFLTRDQIKYFVEKLCNDKILEREGKGRGTRYKKGNLMENSEKLVSRAMKLGLEEMKKRGELDEP